MSVDRQSQIVFNETLILSLGQEWDDLRLKWDPDDYGGVHKLNIPSDDLWKPDIVLYNKYVHRIKTHERLTMSAFNPH